MTRQLGSKYTLGESLGRGAMGQVFEGTDTEGNSYAFKILHSDLADDPVVVARFLQERSILISLDDPALVRVHDLVAEGGTLGIVMDLVDGVDLRHQLSTGTRPTPYEIAQIGAAVAGSLVVVHSAGIVHGDIKPENILLDASTATPTPRLTDFGISRIVESSSRTRSTMLVGTPQYVAPELVDGAPASPASDIYSLGIMLYELCCGVTPFVGGSTMAVLRRHMDVEPGRPDGIPDGLWDLIAWTLAKNPGARPQSAQQLQNLLQGLLPALVGIAPAPTIAQPPIGNTSPSGEATGSFPVAAAAAAGGAAGSGVGVGAAGTSQTEPSRPPRRRRKAKVLAMAAILVLALGAGGYGAVKVQGALDDSSDPQAADHTPAGSGSQSTAVVHTPTTPKTSQTTSPGPTTPASTGPFVMPDLVGQTLADAAAAIPTSIKVTTVDIYSEQAIDGKIDKQIPDPGAPVEGSVTLNVERQPVLVYLENIENNNDVFDEAPYPLSGKTYPHSLAIDTCDDTTSVEFTLGRHFRTLVSTLGINDNADDSSTKILVEVFADGRRVDEKTLTYGKPLPLSLDVTGVLRLKFTVSYLHGYNCYDNNVAVLGEARLLGAPGEVPHNLEH
jgi:Protein kinase domain/NPCBM/NEW2 domain/PASTA domain